MKNQTMEQAELLKKLDFLTCGAIEQLSHGYINKIRWQNLRRTSSRARMNITEELILRQLVKDMERCKVATKELTSNK